MKLKSNNGHAFFIDKEDYEKINRLGYGTYLTKNGYIVILLSRKEAADMGKKSRWLYIQKLIMNPPAGMLVDHINHNKLDNRKRNLRVCTRAQNQQNRRGPNKGLI